MRWVYRQTYAGPDRRSDQFTVRFIERRSEKDVGTRASLQSSLKQVVSRGMRWVDDLKYFGPDRRAADFSFFFLERRRNKTSVGKPPPLQTALRQLRVRVMDADNAANRTYLIDRLVATVLLADAQAFAPVGDLLMNLVRELEACPEDGDPRPTLHAELNRAEAMLTEERVPQMSR